MMARAGSRMFAEINEIPQVAARLIKEQGPAIAKLAEKLKPAAQKGVTLVARGTSDNACLYAKYLFEILLGYPVHLAAPSTVTLFRSRMRLDGHLVIGVSQSGESTDVCEYMEKARQWGARTIGVSNSEKSRLAKASEFSVPLCAGEEKAVAATKTFAAELLVMRMLVSAMTGDRTMRDTLPGLPALLETALESRAQVGDIVSRYRYMEAAVVLGRGYDYSVAQEFALKLMETSYVPVHPFSFADFLHGPVAVMHEGFPTFVFHSRGPTAKPVQDLMKNVLERGGELVVFSDQPVKLRGNVWTVGAPMARHEIDSPLLLIVPAYLFAYNLSVVRGSDPDAPRGLTKVTHTR